MGACVDDREGPAIFGRDVRARAVGGEARRARTSADVEYRHHLQRHRINHGDLAVVLRGDVHPTTVRAQRHALRLTAHRQLRHDFAGGDLHDAGQRRILVGDEDAGAVRADRDLFRVGAGPQDGDHPLLGDVDDANPVGGPIRRRQGVFVHSRGRRRRPTEGHEQLSAVRANFDAARALAKWDGGGHLVGTPSDDGEIARPFICDVDQVGWRRGFGHRRGGFSRWGFVHRSLGAGARTDDEQRRQQGVSFDSHDGGPHDASPSEDSPVSASTTGVAIGSGAAAAFESGSVGASASGSWAASGARGAALAPTASCATSITTRL